MPAKAPSFPSAVVTSARQTADRAPDAALLGAALGLCALALIGAGVVGRVRREAGMA